MSSASATAVMAIDPGKTSGWATFDLATEEFKSGQEDFDGACAVMMYAADPNVQLVSEAFLITVQTAKNTQATWSLELIGVARYVARSLAGRDLILQAPGAAKRFSSDERLKRLGWYKPGQGHANDAARHLLLCLVKTRLWWPEALATSDDPVVD